MNSKQALHVAVGVIENSNNQILISKRQSFQDHKGLWEFPGGKCQTNEAVTEALAREFKEELGLDLIQQRPLIKIYHDYQNYRVLLDVWKIIHWSGNAKGCEGQEIFWQPKDSLHDKHFLKANGPIIQAIQLPDKYFITPEPEAFSEDVFLNRVSTIIQSGIRLIQFRCKSRPIKEYQSLLKIVSNLCEKNDVKLLINTKPGCEYIGYGCGLHISSQVLNQLSVRPISKEKLFSVSCHNEKEVQKAQEIDADMVLLGIVKKTSSHPEQKAMGWEKFKEIAEHCNIPIYALGGMCMQDIEDAWNYGGQGVAMIRGLWESHSIS